MFCITFTAINHTTPVNSRFPFDVRSQRALGNIGVCYENGDGVTKNYREARRLYALASAQGDATATQNMNRLDEKIRTECPLLGTRVVITGTSREDLNGRAGVAATFDHARGRYVVELDRGEGEKKKEQLKIKPENLRTKTGGRQGKNGSRK